MTIYSLDVLLSQFGTIRCSMSGSSSCFLTSIQVSQEAGQVVWYSHLFQNVPQFVVIHTVKGCSNIPHLEFSSFSMIQQMLAIWSLVPLTFLKQAWTSETPQSTYCWSLDWRILSITLLLCETSSTVWYFEHSLALPLFGFGMKTDLFQSCGPCWVFQIWWHIEYSTFTASSFQILNSSAVIPSLSLCS